MTGNCNPRAHNLSCSLKTLLLIEAAPLGTDSKQEEIGLFWAHLLLTHYTARSILWGQGQEWRLHEIKYNNVLLSFMYCTCPSLIEVRYFSSLPLPQYIASPKFCTSLVTAPDRLRVTATNNLPFSPWHVWSLVRTTQLCSQGHCCRFWVCFFCFREKLLPPAPGFPRSLHTCPTSPSYYAIRQVGLHFGVQSPADAYSVSETKSRSALSTRKE